MTNKIKVSELPEFDMTEHLPDEQAIAEYLTVVLEENDPAALADALRTIARARSMSEIASASGLTREALYKALRPGAHPRFDTIARVCAALGVKLVAQVAHAYALPPPVLCCNPTPFQSASSQHFGLWELHLNGALMIICIFTLQTEKILRCIRRLCLYKKNYHPCFGLKIHPRAYI